MTNLKTVLDQNASTYQFAKFQKNKIDTDQLKALKGGIIIEEVVLA